MKKNYGLHSLTIQFDKSLELEFLQSLLKVKGQSLAL